MYRRDLKKADGRNLFLYSWNPIAETIEAPMPPIFGVGPNPHLRWHPLREEWVAYASHRQNRTFLPPAEYSPLLPTTSDEFPTEVPQGDYGVAVFDNLFPSLFEGAHSPPDVGLPTRPGSGICEVVVFTQDPKTSLGQLPLEQIELVLNVWADRYLELSCRPGIRYILPFENRGVEVGVTLHHPHGQIYAYPFVPPIPERALAADIRYRKENGVGLLDQMIQTEISEKTRMIFESPGAVAFVPPCARYSYEVWVVPRREVASLDQLELSERRDLARALKTVLLKYDGLWNRPFPYLMAVYQRPVGESGPYHLHFEFLPPYRTKDRLKYLAGTEVFAGMFANDSLPEEKAAELRAVGVLID